MRLLCVLALSFGLSGCLVSRTISDVAAHDRHNSYKVQTLSVYWALFSAWHEWDVWSCHRDAERYRCREIGYEASKLGIQRPEAAAPAPEPEPEPEPESESEPEPEPAPEPAPVPDSPSVTEPESEPEPAPSAPNPGGQP